MQSFEIGECLARRRNCKEGTEDGVEQTRVTGGEVREEKA